MKIELYYIVRPYKGGKDSIGRSSDGEYINGPFPSWSKAFDAKQDTIKTWDLDSYDIVKQTIEVDY
jgi:hypothetical protein